MSEHTPASRLATWLDRHPEACRTIARFGVLGLWVTDDGNGERLLGDHEDFMSGADFIDHFCQGVGQSGCGEVIKSLIAEQPALIEA